ncbi:MAG: GNAT family N-acetyltransferase [Armatimonadetes bacterium]|nr:GNAT family N-acetyltransferase [Armatimonadota bacterium]
MKNLICREMVWPDEIEAMLSIRNAIFPPVSAEEWLKHPSNTASMAWLEGVPIGAIPLDQRQFQIAPGRTICAAFEHAVGTREDFRSRGVGAAMIDAAREFLADRCECLMVYRGGERTPGYRFYVKSGHRDLIYMRTLTWRPDDVQAGDVHVGDRDEAIAAGAELLPVFERAFAGYGGFPPRHEGYWEHALNDMIWAVIPSTILFFRYPSEGPLQAYCIASMRETFRADELVTIQEIAGLSEEAVREVLRAVGAEAVERGRAVTTIACVDSPYRMLMREMGFTEGERHTMIMGQVIAGERLFEKVCADFDAVAELKINVWAPDFDFPIWEGPDAKREITIEGKDIAVIRMLCRRMDVKAAVAMDLLTIQGEEDDDRERLAAALPYCPWEYHRLDWT